MSAQTIAWIVAVCFMALAMVEIPTMPRCPFCGKWKVHAKDCSTNHRGGDDG